MSRLSVVATLYHSAVYLEEFHRRVTEAAVRCVGDDYEIVLVNDGSPDDSLQRAVRLMEGDPRLRIVDLSRNFGHHRAMMTGLAHSRGELIFLIDSDLEEQPEWLEPFLVQLKADDCDVVFGVQRNRKGGWFERVSGALFYRLMKAWGNVEMAPDMVTARLMSKRYVQALLLHREREVDIGGLWFLTGFEQRAQLVDKGGHSNTTYTLSHKLKLVLNSVTSFSNAPILAIVSFGFATSFLAALALVICTALWVALEVRGPPWGILIASVWLLGGLTIACLGVVGLYVAKTNSEVRARPYTIVRQVYERD